MITKRNRAIVVGASVAGLLAGRSLADFFDEVVLFDKERLDEGPMTRKAVPQGGHIHAILSPTYRILKRFVPEVVDDLVAGGAHVFDGGKDWRFFTHGNFLASGETGRKLIGSSRPFFEHSLRSRVTKISHVDLKADHRFKRWLMGPANDRVIGVVVEHSGLETEWEADLIIDARGSGSSLSRELTELGYDAPPEEVVRVDLGYTTRIYRTHGFSPDWTLLIVNPSAPRTWIGGLIERIEDNRWIVTQFGYFGDHAAADEGAFLAQARKLPVQDIADFLEIAEPASDFRRFGTPECKMRRFEKLNRFPDRLLVIGDAVCGLNPIYGQGMTKAAREAEYLSDSLSRHLARTDSLDGFCRPFRRGLPSAGAEWAWQLTTGADLGYPQTIGKRQPVIGAFMGWYIKRLFERSASSLDARRRLFDVLMLVEPPDRLMRPEMIRHVLGA